MIKEQFEEILKDAKILCELEPFVKKWSIDEMLPHFLEEFNPLNETNKLTLTEILRNVKPKSSLNPDDDGSNAHEDLFRSLKGIMMAPKGNDDDPSHSSTFRNAVDNLLLEEDQYDHELEKTLKALQEIEYVQDAVTQTDIQEFVRGLGGKPDGLDLKRTNIREWKNIFLEHWFDLNHRDMTSSSKASPNMIKQKKATHLPNIISKKSAIKKDHRKDMLSSVKSADRYSVCPSTSSRANLDNHFMTRKERKNMATSYNKKNAAQGEESRKYGLSPTYQPRLFAEYDEGGGKKSLLTLRKEHGPHETSLAHIMEGKIANSALIGAASLLPQQDKKSLTNDFKAYKKLNFYEEQAKQTKGIVRKNILNEVQFKAEEEKKKSACLIQKLKDKRGKMSVRPSSAVPNYIPTCTVTRGVYKPKSAQGEKVNLSK